MFNRFLLVITEFSLLTASLNFLGQIFDVQLLKSCLVIIIQLVLTIFVKFLFHKIKNKISMKKILSVLGKSLITVLVKFPVKLVFKNPLVSGILEVIQDTANEVVEHSKK